MNYLNIPVGTESPQKINAIVEIPKASSNKYEYCPDWNIFKLDRALHSPIYYPGEYGFIPSTLGEDGDPLDVLILCNLPTFTGCLIEVRPVGCLIMEDDHGMDYKILGVPTSEPRASDVTDLSHISKHTLIEIEHFFKTYKTLENKQTRTDGWKNLEETYTIIRAGVQRFLDWQDNKIDRWGHTIISRRKTKKH